MEGLLIEKINIASLEKVESLLPDFDKYSLNKTFTALYNSEQDFVQCCYVDRTDKKNLYKCQEKEILVSVEDAEELNNDIKEYNEALKKAQDESADEFLTSSYDKRDYFYFSRVGDSIGICHILMLERNKSREQQEEQERMAEHKRRMKEDKDYRRENEWFNEQDRPYSGAFNSWDDYFRHVL
jgi:hypothetical protein